MTYDDPMLNERSLQTHVDDKYDLMKSKIAVVVKDKYAKSQGNSFAKLTYDGATLVNENKAKSIGSQVVDNI